MNNDDSDEYPNACKLTKTLLSAIGSHSRVSI